MAGYKCKMCGGTYLGKLMVYFKAGKQENLLKEKQHFAENGL